MKTPPAQVANGQGPQAPAFIGTSWSEMSQEHATRNLHHELAVLTSAESSSRVGANVPQLIWPKWERVYHAYVIE